MKTNLKDNIYIVGYNTEKAWQVSCWSFGLGLLEEDEIIWSGKTSEIPEEIAKECVIQNGLAKGTTLDDGEILKKDLPFGFKQYKKGFGVSEFETAKESIQSACSTEYCIIFKI